MNLIRYPMCFVLAFATGLSSTAVAQSADDHYAWIETSSPAHSSLARRREILLLRAARVAEERGFTHFELMKSGDAPVGGGVANDEWKATDAYGNVSNAIYPPRLSASPLRRNGAILVRFCNESEESCPGVRAHQALLNLRP